MAGLAPLSARTVYTYMIMMIVTGSINTIANKMQQNSHSLGKSYSHVWLIVCCMFIGESTCLFWYTIYKFRENRRRQAAGIASVDEIPKDANGVPLKPASPFILAIPACCDFCGSTIQIFGLAMMAGSVYQMFRGSLIFFTALFSVIFLKNKLYKHHYLALVSVICGLVLVGTSSKVWPPERPGYCSSGDGPQESIYGIVLVVCGQIFSASQYIVEEKFMKGYHCHPLKAVGFEGMWGCSIYIILLIVFQNIDCDPASSLTSYVCTADNHGEWKVENTLFAFQQLGDNGLLLFYALLYIMSISVFNFVGISVSKYASSANRAVVDTIRTIVVWIFFLLPFIDECHREYFIWLQLIGFVCLIFGNAVYNEVLELPFLGLNQNTKKAIKARQVAEQQRLLAEHVDHDGVTESSFKN